MRRAADTAGCLLLSLALVAVTAAGARADNDSIVTLGVGSGVGIHKAGAPGEDEQTAFVNQANVRLKALYILGLDYAYDLAHDRKLNTPSAELQYQAKMRLTGLVYPYAGEQLAFYLGGGVGGTSLGEVFGMAGDGLSYHAGFGFEFHLAKHMSIDMSLMFVAPGMRSVRRAAVAEVAAAYAEGGAAAVERYDEPTFDEFLELRNHEFLIRFFLFI